jgi:hypothetical protein
VLRSVGDVKRETTFIQKTKKGEEERSRKRGAGREKKIDVKKKKE